MWRASATSGVRAVLFVGMLATACSPARDAQAPASSGSQQPVRGGTAVLGLPGDLDSFNPYLSRMALGRDVTYHVFDSLMVEQADFGEGPPTFEPALAVSWSSSADGKEITFRLRPDARWSDGQPVTAEDVRFSWQAAIHPDVAWVAADVKEDILDVQALDPHTVRVIYRRVYPYQLMDANDGVILPRHVWSAIPFDRWRDSPEQRAPVGSGPFMMEKWIPNQSIELVRNPHYWGQPEQPRLERVVFRVLPDASAGLQQLLGGNIDYWDRIEPRDRARVEASPAATVRRYQDRYIGFIAWNLRRPPFDDVRVRKALTLAMNRRRMVDDLFLGAASQAYSPLPPLFWAHHRRLSPHPHDRAAARELLDAAGWVDTDGDGVRERNGRPLSFALDMNSDSSLRRDIGLMAQEDLKAVGVAMSLNPLERRVANRQWAQGEFDAFISGWRLPTKVSLSGIFHTDAMKSGVNWGGYSNKRLDEILDRADQQADPERARGDYHAAQEILHEELPYTFLYWQERLVGYSSRLQGVDANAQSPLFNLEDWWLGSDS